MKNISLFPLLSPILMLSFGSAYTTTTPFFWNRFVKYLT